MTILSYLKRIVIGEAICLDEAGNVLLPEEYKDVPDAGNPHNTISQRLAQMRANGSKIGCVGCKVLTWVQNKIFSIEGDHCTNALQGFPDKLPTDG
jgi:hypothetical protein